MMFKKIVTVMLALFFVMSMSTASMAADSVDPYTDDTACDWSEFKDHSCSSWEAMLTEDAPFECIAAKKTKLDPADSKLSLKAELAEGIPYTDGTRQKTARKTVTPNYSFRTDTIFFEGIPYPEEIKPERDIRIAKNQAVSLY